MICTLLMASCAIVLSVCVVGQEAKPQPKKSQSCTAKKERVPNQAGQGATGTPNGGPQQPQQPQQRQPPQQPKVSAVWSISGPPERLRIPDNSETQFTVSANEKPISDLGLIQSTLQDTASLVQLGTDAISLCAEGTNKKCESPINVAANSIRRVTLKIDPTFKSPGIFTGELRFSVAEQPEIKSFKLTVYSRPSTDVRWGAFGILSGLLTYFFIHVWLRVRLARDEALLPVYELRDTLDALKAKIEPVSSQTGYVFGGLDQALTAVGTQLSNSQIRTYLPPVFPKPGTPSDDWASSFKAYLNPLRDRVAGFVVLTNSGVLRVAPYWSTNQAAARTAFAAIDGLAGTVNNAETAQAKLAPLIQPLLNAINQPAAQALAPFLAAAPVGLTRFFTDTPNELLLRVDLYRNTLWLWVAWTLVAFLAGMYVLVLSNLGFGTFADIIKCYFWGLGFSVAGGQLEQLTQSSVTGSFGINVPKA